MILDDYTQEKILNEIGKIQYLYGLKKVIRYNQSRHATDSTESVAEHVYGMIILAQYFLPLENPKGTWDRARIYEMISLHDVEEIETGDTLGYAKTTETRVLELEAMKRAIQKSPASLQEHLNARVNEYEGRKTPEAQFVKAIDKIEPFFQIFNEDGRLLLQQNKTTAEQSLRIKTPYIQEFPFIKLFADTIHKALLDGSYYWTGE